MGKFLDAVEEKIETLTKNVEALVMMDSTNAPGSMFTISCVRYALLSGKMKQALLSGLTGKPTKLMEILQRIIIKGVKKTDGNSKDG